MDPAAVSFAAAMGAGVGLIAASLLHIPYLELPLLMLGLVVGGSIGFLGLGVVDII